MDGGKTRATLRFKEGNIQSFADKMYKLNNETTWGETEGLRSKDYADILRVWIDMGIHTRESLNERKYYVTYNRGRGQGKGLEKVFDKKAFKSTDKPMVFNSYKDAKEYAEKMEKMFRNSIGGGTAYWVSDEKMNPINESDLKGYLIADVVDDIIKAIGPRFVSGEIKQSNRNKIYLKLTDVKVGSGVVKLLKSKFGIDAKEEMFGGKDKFGSIPSVSFFANKVINEELYKVAGRPVTLIKGKKSDATDWKVKFQNGKETSLSDVLALIKPFPKGVHWRYKNLEGVNEK
jgi:hypothetical protein